MLNVLYDKCFAAIQFLVSTHILKRLSANNTSSTAIASEKWMQKNASEPHHRILRDLMSPNALLYMKQEVLDPARKDLKRSFFSSVVVVDPLCRQAAVKDLLLKCRWEEIRSAAIKKKKMLMYEHMPVVTQQDARRFIKTGADPLSQYIKSCDDALISSEFGSDETSSLVEGRKRLIKYNMFLAHISAIDMIDIIFESILNTVQQPIKIKQAERARADSRSALDGFSRRPSHDGETNLHSRRGSKSRSNVAFGTSRDMDGDNDSDTMSINSSYSTSSRQSFSSVPIPPSGRRNSNRHKHSGRRLEVVQKKKY